jgi:transposase InsO family protein
MKFSPRRLISPFIAVVAIVTGLFYGAALLAGLGAIGLVAWIGAAWYTHGRAQVGPHMSELGPEGRRLFKPLKAIRNEIALLAKAGPRPNVQIVAKSALEDADKMLACTAVLLLRRREIVTLMRSHKMAEADLARIERRMASASSESEEEARKQALEFRQDEASRLADVEEALKEIDSRIAQAETALTQLKWILSDGAAPLEQVQSQAEQLGGLTNRLKSLNRTFEEAEETFRQHS